MADRDDDSVVVPSTDKEVDGAAVWSRGDLGMYGRMGVTGLSNAIARAGDGRMDGTIVPRDGT